MKLMRGLLRVSGVAIVCAAVAMPATSGPQLGAVNRAVQRAVETNARTALERVQLSLRVRDSAGKVVVQSASRSGRYLLLVFEDNRPRVWDLEQSRYWDHFDAIGSPVVAAAIGSDMGFATIHSDGRIARWSPESRQPVSLAETPLRKVRLAAMDRTRGLVIVNGDGEVYRFDDALSRLGQAFADLGAARTPMAMGPSGDVVATAVSPSELHLWSTRNGASIARVSLDRTLSAFTFGDVSSQLLVATRGAVVDWDTSASMPMGEFSCPGQCRLQQLLVNAATQALIAVNEDGGLVRWSLGGRHGVGDVLYPDEVFAEVSTSSSAPVIVGETALGLLRFSHLAKPDAPLTLVSTRRGWAMVDALGRFDGQAGIDNGVSWGNDEFDFPLPSFVDSHFEPGLFAKWLSGGAGYFTDPRALRDGVLSPPRIEMALEALDTNGAEQRIEVRVKLTDTGGGLGEPSLYHLGLRVGADKLVERKSAVENDRKVSLSTWRVKALPGDNTFTARVQDAEGVVAPGRVASVEAADGIAAPALHILAIAIDDYGDERVNLNYSVVDADAIVDKLERLGAPLFGTVRKTVLRNEKATRENVMAAVRALRATNPDDVVVIYAATHGEVFDERFHLLLHGLRLPVSKRLVRQVGLPFDTFAEELEALDARRVMMLLDTCKSGDALEDLETEFRDRRALQRFGNLLGLHLIAATAKGQLATESSVLGHGVFTYSLIQGLEGSADRQPVDGLLTAAELARFAEAGVPALSAQYAAFPQWPTIYTRGFDFTVAAGSARNGAGSAASPPSRVPGPPR